MHTFSGQIISPLKISLLKLDGTTNANEFLMKLVEDDRAKCKEKYPSLYGYYEYVRQSV